MRKVTAAAITVHKTLYYFLPLKPRSLPKTRGGRSRAERLIINANRELTHKKRKVIQKSIEETGRVKKRRANETRLLSGCDIPASRLQFDHEPPKVNTEMPSFRLTVTRKGEKNAGHPSLRRNYYP